MATTSKIKDGKKDHPLLASRMKAQLLTCHEVSTVQTLVQKMGALQAQHLEMTQWAIGKRLSLCSRGEIVTAADVQKALEKGHIVRTHALRPTWQLLSGEDLLWILQLTGPAIKKTLFSRDKHLGIEEKEYVRSDKAIYRILEKHPNLSRQELITALTQLGFAMDEYRSNHYIMHAELQGIICSGPVSNDKHTYALVEKVLGKNYKKAENLKNTLKDQAGIQQLASRYFSTRGPASIQDFAWWSGLGITQIKKAIAALGDKLSLVEDLQQTPTTAFYQMASNVSAAGAGLAAVNSERLDANLQFLAAFDEYLISYKDRTAMLPAAYNKQIITVNGLFRPAVVEKGQVIAGWQVEKQIHKGAKTGLKIKLLPFTPLNTAAQKQILKLAEPEALAYARFRQLPLEALVMG